MILTKILADISYTTNKSADVLSAIDVSDIVYDSRRATATTMFACLVGAAADGHNFAKSAYENGCRVFLCERELDVGDDAIEIYVSDTREALALASAVLFEYPARSLAVIGVTGTKGKSTTVSIIADILNAAGINTACIGTTGIVINGERTPTKNTTPESYELHKAFKKMVESGVSAVVMEVSSQATYMRRVVGIHFHIGVFTNLSHDHIGGVEHPTFEHYMQCKAALFASCRYAIFNNDDEHYTDMVRASRAINSTFGISENIPHDVSARDISRFDGGNILGTRFTVKSIFGEDIMEIPMPGEFNVYNALVAISVAQRMQVPPEIIKSALARASVKGRFEIVEALPRAVTIIDYAHNEASMRAALETIRAYNPTRLVVLFGSVGGRSEMRRAELGSVAASLADFCIITSDNPDREPPENIIADIEKAVDAVSCPHVCFVDRRDAVRYAIDNARDGDCILFAGKGHEDYQIINGEYVHYDEREEILAAANARLAKVE